MDTPRSARLVALFLVLIFVTAATPRETGAAPPEAIDDGGFQTPVNTPVQIPIATILANDFDPDGGPVNFDTDYQPFANNGAVTPDYGAQVLVYAPNAGFTGGDIIFYQIEDEAGELAQATVSVFVFVPNNAPVAAADEYVMGQNETLIVQGSAGLFINDYDPDGDGVSLNAYDPSSAPGSLTVSDNGGFSYTPASDLVGTVVFTYSITDGSAVSNIATATVYIQGPTNPTTPPTVGDDAYGTPKDVPLVVSAPGVLGNDVDADDQPISAVLVGSAASGVVSLQGDGSFTYTPNAGYVGADSFTYQAFDGTLSSGIATVTITVSATNLLPVPADDEFQTGRNAALAIPFGSLLANDSDVDGPALFVLTGQFGSPTNGTLQVDAGNSRVTYTPTTDFIGVDSFTYRISDGIASSQDAATVRITVTNLVQPEPTAGSAPTPSATAPVATTPATQPGTATDAGAPRSVGSHAVTTLPSVGTGSVTGAGLPLTVIAPILAALGCGAAVRWRSRTRRSPGSNAV